MNLQQLSSIDAVSSIQGAKQSDNANQADARLSLESRMLGAEFGPTSAPRACMPQRRCW
jgi:hypothetical protein